MLLRFNPDGYNNSTGVKVPSCWRKTPSGLLAIGDEGAWNERLETLLKVFNDYLEKPVEDLKEVDIVKLFYDGFGV